MGAMPTLRPATAADYPIFANLFPALETGDATPTAARWAAELADNTIVAEEGGTAVGYLYAQTLDGTGYVRHVVVDARARGRGVGRRMMTATAARFRAAGATRWCLNVKPENHPARRLYEAVGMRAVYGAVSLGLDWKRAAKLPVAAEVEARPILPADDAAIESTLGLVRGQLADARLRPSRMLRQLRDAHGPAGVAIFDPEFPGAFPFRVRAPGYVGALLAALRPLARPEHDVVNVVIEDDEPLAQALLAAGATERLRFVHYDGPVPPV
jgi:GNAT superfamily N-acetyltransferase